VSKFSGGIGKAGKELRAFKGTLTSAAGSVGSFGAALAGGIASSAATAGLGLIGDAARSAKDFLIETATAGASLSAAMSTAKVVFGDAASTIVGDARGMADEALSSEKAFIQAATRFGSVFKGVGKSQADAAKLGSELTKLGIDLARFADKDNETAFTALQAALRGEFDPLEQFGVFLSAAKIEAEAMASGLAKGKGELTEYAKKQAALNLILRQTKDAQGTARREMAETGSQIASFGEQVQTIKERLGAALEPITHEFVALANQGIGAVTRAISENQDAIKGWANEIASSNTISDNFIADVGIGFNVLIHVSAKAEAAFHAVAGTILGIGEATVRELDSLAKGIAGVINSVPLGQPKVDFGGGLGEMADQLDALGKAQFAKADELWNADGWDQIAGIFEAIKERAHGAAEGMKEAAKATATTGAQMGDTAAKIAALSRELKEQQDTVGLTGNALKIYKLEQQAAAEAAKAMKETAGDPVSSVEAMAVAAQTKAQIDALKGQALEIQGREDGAKALQQMKSDAQSLFTETRSPLEKFQAEMGKLKVLAEQGLIGPDLFVRGVQKAKGDAFGDTGTRFAEAKGAGSAEAFGSIFRHQFGGSDDPNRQVATNTREILNVMKRIESNRGGKLTAFPLRP
jgi:hypothetical protein